MSENRRTPQFGISIDPSAANPQEAFQRAKIADENGIDLVTAMDHPYNMKLFDTWTLMTAIAVHTQHVRIGTNVLSIPLRPPAVLAKMAATLDVLSNGRMELGIGAGAYWDGIAAFGGPRRRPGEAYEAFKDALHILRGLWDEAGRSFSYDGEFYQVQGARPGPAPVHRIPIWVGARGPRMLRLLGRMADGLLISYDYKNPDKLLDTNRFIDEGAAQAGRSPHEIRRGYNLMGLLDINGTATRPEGDLVFGDVDAWAEKIINWYQNYGQDTFIFWPTGERRLAQVETFAGEVVPAVTQALAQGIQS